MTRTASTHKIDLKKAGLQITQPRRLILELLQKNSDEHLSAEEIYRRLLKKNQTIGIATVYRVLSQFEGANIITRHQFDGTTSVFELNQGKHHDHLICSQCGKITEFVDEEIERLQRLVAEKHGFTIESHLLYLFGRCSDPECQQETDS